NFVGTGVPRRSTPQGFGDHKPSVNGPSGDAGPYKKGAAWRLFCFYQHPDKPKFERHKNFIDKLFPDGRSVGDVSIFCGGLYR
ncbi:MAG: hypothetical protein IJW99_07550, partial [Clostridia bacterium]|nr:hypothetical protein [Clostridia bacterium]